MRHLSSQRISPSRAQQLLAEFLEATTTDPSLHPNALLTEDGPIVASSGSTGLVLHNLKRVETGLRGEHLAADLTFKSFGGEGLPDVMNNGIPGGAEEGGKGILHVEQDADEGWQDKGEYEREQAIEQGEVGSRSNALEDLNADRRMSNDFGEIPAVQRAEAADKVSKEERKRKKKEKRDRMKRDREVQTQKEAKAEKRG
ncbi:MAG: hypothetical protein Q9166_003445 [cf. Caloplaca sp. 2 TL-2023]